MKIGIDARMTDWSGIGTYSMRVIDELAKNMEDHLVLFTNPKTNGYTGPIAENVMVVEADQPVFTIRFTPWERILEGAGLDVFFTPYILMPYTIPCPAVGTIHDMIPWRMPSVLKRVSGRIFYRNFIKKAVKNFNRILVDSEFTKNDVKDFLGINPLMLETVPAAASGSFTRIEDRDKAGEILCKYGIKEPYLLNVGTARLHKNLEFLIRSFKLFIDKHNLDVQLVFAGPQGHLRDKHRRMVKDLGIEEQVVFTGEIEEDDLPVLYNLAFACAFPSMIEGFGLPALESMACGTPVVCTNGSSLAEVVGEAGILLDIKDEQLWADAFLRLTKDGDLREKLSIAGLQRAKTFSWQKTAVSIRKALDTAANVHDLGTI